MSLVDILPTIPIPEKKSHLPAWLLATSVAVEASSRARLLVEDRIKGIIDDSRALGDRITDAAAPRGGRLLALPLDQARGYKSDEDCRPPVPCFGLHVLPEDIVCIVASYFDSARELSRFSMGSISTNEYMLSDMAGYVTFFERHRLVQWDRSPGCDLRAAPAFIKFAPQPIRLQQGRQNDQQVAEKTIRGKVILHAAALSGVCGFVERLRRANSSARTSDVRPHRYFKHEKSLSHPLPHVVDSKGRLSGEVMGMAVTMSRDVRSEALKFLELACFVSAHGSLHDARASKRLRSCGAITAMVALLSNESAAVTELACCVLANLLCTSSTDRRRHRCKCPMGGGDDADDAAADDDDYDDDGGVDPRAVVERCDGKIGLRALLTSPSARVITNTSIPALAPHDCGGGGGGGRSSGRAGGASSSKRGELRGSLALDPRQAAGRGRVWEVGETRQTFQFCLGMACKHAARALCNLWCPPEMEVTTSMIENNVLTVPWDDDDDDQDDDNHALSIALEASFSLDKDSASSDDVDNGDDNDRACGMRDAVRRRPLTAPKFEGGQRRLVKRNRFRRMRAHYFYGKGTEKDVSNLDLALHPNGAIEGMGVDNLGRFVLAGKAHGSVGTLTYSFHKTYVDRGASNVPLSGHVIHTAFWAGRAATREGDGCGDKYSDQETPPSSSRGLDEQKKVPGISSHNRYSNFYDDNERLGGGFWGVWELVTGVPHFELDNSGGVFRMVPVQES